MSRRRRFEAYLYSRRNIAGSLLALGGLGLFFTGLLTGPIWVPVVAGLYAIGVLLVPGEQQLDLRLDANADAPEVHAGLMRLLDGLRGRVAGDIYDTVAQIAVSIETTLAATPANMGLADHNLYLIRQTALDYLPTALSAYLAVPRSFAEASIVAGGRTAHDELLDQLQLMASKLQEVGDDIARNDSDRLFANGRFLAEKFAPGSLTVDQSAAQGAVAASAAELADVPAVTQAETAVPAAPVAIEQEQVQHARERVR